MSIDTGNAVGIRVASLDEMARGRASPSTGPSPAPTTTSPASGKLDKLRIRSMLEESPHDEDDGGAAVPRHLGPMVAVEAGDVFTATVPGLGAVTASFSLSGEEQA